MALRLSIALFLVLAASWTVTARAEEKPLWEVGLGVGAAVLPDYTGSDESRVYPGPLPYVIYRGKFLQADRDGVRTRLFNRPYAELSVSAGGSLPVDSDDNNARQGLPDLKPTLELGPALDLHLWRSKNAKIKLDLDIPVRLPVTLESSPRSIGVVLAPRLSLDVADFAGFQGWDFGFSVGPNFADKKYHDYFYTVAPRFATPDRPAFDAGGGYSSTAVLTAISKRFPSYWVGAFLRYETLSGATYQESPLVKRGNAVVAGVGIAWIIGRSKRLVEVDE
jgi:outer membrane scaffolding protein for murein synthesis (MipA/OmpV family)